MVRTWSEQPNDIRYRIFRALQKKSIQSTDDLAEKLYQLVIHHLVGLPQCSFFIAVTFSLQELDDVTTVCEQIVAWAEQAICYGHPAMHSLLATFYKFGLCGLASNSTQVGFFEAENNAFIQSYRL